MAVYDTTATVQGDAWIRQATPNTSRSTSLTLVLMQSDSDKQRILAHVRMPSKPLGADRIDEPPGLVIREIVPDAIAQARDSAAVIVGGAGFFPGSEDFHRLTFEFDG